MTGKEQKFQADAPHKKKPQRWGWRRLRKAVVPSKIVEEKRLIPDEFIEDMYVPLQGRRILCSLWRDHQTYSGTFVVDEEHETLYCEHLSSNGDFFARPERWWYVMGETDDRDMNPEDQCGKESDARRFDSIEAQCFHRLREMLYSRRVFVPQWLKTDFDKVCYTIDEHGRYTVSSLGAPFAELFAMSVSLIL